MQVGGPLGSLGFVNLSTIDIWGWLTLGHDGSSSHCRMKQCPPGLYPLDTSGAVPTPTVVTAKNIFRCCQTSSRGTDSSTGRTTGLCGCLHPTLISLSSHHWTQKMVLKMHLPASCFKDPSYLKRQVPRWKKSASVEIIHSSIPP